MGKGRGHRDAAAERQGGCGQERTLEEQAYSERGEGGVEKVLGRGAREERQDIRNKKTPTRHAPRLAGLMGNI